MVDYAEQERLDNVIGHTNHLESRIVDLEHEAHDREMFIDELERRIQRLEERVNMIEFYRRREH